MVDHMKDNQKPRIANRISGTLHFHREPRVVREEAIKSQQRIEETLIFRAELRRATDLLPPFDPV
jgi:hypothetical protein